MSVRGTGSRGSSHGIFWRLYWPIFIQLYTKCNHPLPCPTHNGTPPLKNLWGRQGVRTLGPPCTYIYALGLRYVSTENPRRENRAPTFLYNTKLMHVKRPKRKCTKMYIFYLILLCKYYTFEICIEVSSIVTVDHVSVKRWIYVFKHIASHSNMLFDLWHILQ